jgi:hypothetical protein
VSQRRASQSNLVRPGVSASPPRSAADRFHPQPLGSPASPAQPEIDIDLVIGRKIQLVRTMLTSIATTNPSAVLMKFRDGAGLAEA